MPAEAGHLSSTPEALRARRIMWICWPAFLGAGVLEIIVFAVVDPHDLHWFGQTIELSRPGVYTVAFFAFWLVLCASGALTSLLAMPAARVNDAGPVELRSDQGTVARPSGRPGD